MAGVGTLLLTCSSLWAESLYPPAPQVIAQRLARSRQQWLDLSQRIAKRQNVTLNDDGSVSFFYPTYHGTGEYLTALASDPDAVCSYQMQTLVHSNKSRICEANPISIRGSGYLSTCLGIPHVPDGFGRDQYYHFNFEDKFLSIRSKEIVGDENIAKIACLLPGHKAPLSKSYKSISYTGRRALISEPYFAWNKNVFDFRYISLKTEFDTVCQHFGFDRHVGEVVSDRQSFFNSKSVYLDKARIVRELVSSNTEDGRYIVEITCEVD
jgi:hypothetical protein